MTYVRETPSALMRFSCPTSCSSISVVEKDHTGRARAREWKWNVVRLVVMMVVVVAENRGRT